MRRSKVDPVGQSEVGMEVAERLRPVEGELGVTDLALVAPVVAEVKGAFTSLKRNGSTSDRALQTLHLLVQRDQAGK